MNKDALVHVERVSKRFCRSFKRSLWYGLQDIFTDLRGGNASQDLRKNEFWAVKDASFELRRGECLGLIGANGAGKTTLLRMLGGLIKPDAGRIEIRGRAGGLIALGAGFNPILTGRENIYVNAAILGISKREADKKFDQIVDFAELNESIDMPVQNYSSGMCVRLGFAIAAILIKPDVLFLDEVLAVGDIGFTIKCLNAVRQLSDGAAVIFVSHNMQFVSSFCNRVIVMNQGLCMLDTTEVPQGIDHYFSMITLQQQKSGAGGASINFASLKVDGIPQKDQGQEPKISHGKKASLSLRGEIKAGKVAQLNVFIIDEAMMPVISFPVEDKCGRTFRLAAGQFNIDVPLGPLELRTGKYSFVIALADADKGITLTRLQGLLPFRIYADRSHWGKLVRTTQAIPTSPLS